jgi:hypothetical protein
MLSLLVTVSEMFSQFFGNAFSSEDESLSDEVEFQTDDVATDLHDAHGLLMR